MTLSSSVVAVSMGAAAEETNSADSKSWQGMAEPLEPGVVAGLKEVVAFVSPLLVRAVPDQNSRLHSLRQARVFADNNRIFFGRSVSMTESAVPCSTEQDRAHPVYCPRTCRRHAVAESLVPLAWKGLYALSSTKCWPCYSALLMHQGPSFGALGTRCL